MFAILPYLSLSSKLLLLIPYRLVLGTYKYSNSYHCDQNVTWTRDQYRIESSPYTMINNFMVNVCIMLIIYVWWYYYVFYSQSMGPGIKRDISFLYMSVSWTRLLSHWKATRLSDIYFQGSPSWGGLQIGQE